MPGIAECVKWIQLPMLEADRNTFGLEVLLGLEY